MASDKRIKVTLACSECKQRNYNTMKNKKMQEAHQPQGNQVKRAFRR